MATEGGGKPLISDELMALLVCPVDHAELKIEGSDLVCTKCGTHYPVVDGIPNMLPPVDR